MTGPEDSSSTRPISVAELLARNGTIGAAPPGGRRRRRRGSADSVTVAELTGEIPIIRGHDDETPTGSTSAIATEAPAESESTTSGTVDQQVEAEPADALETADVEPEVAEAAEAPEVAEAAEVEDAESDEAQDRTADADDVYTAAPTSTQDVDEGVDEDDDYADADAVYTAHVTERDSDADLDFFAPPRRSHYAPRRFQSAAVGAEQMSPDPVDEDVLETPVELAPAEADERADEAHAGEEPDTPDSPDTTTDDRDELPSYMRSSDNALFGGHTLADEADEADEAGHAEDLDAVEETKSGRPTAMRSFVRAAWVVGQCVIAVAFGAGLFVAFDQLWKWNNIVALVLSVLVILGLVVGVRVVRKTEDIGSTLIAVAVGALVTLGPLALLQSG
jgi:hypothetical protein